MPTVTSLKSMLQSQVAPGNDAEFLRLLTEADMRLLQFGKWRWTRTRVTLTPVDGYIALPGTLASILGAQVQGQASDIRDEQFEFCPGGPGEVVVNGASGVMLIDQGLDGTTGERTYKVTGQLAVDTEVVCLCHKAPATLYDPALEDEDLPAEATDTTICPDPAALKHAMLGIVLEEANEPEQSSKYFSIALRTLDNKEKSFRGGSRQMFNIRPNSPGISAIRALR